MKEKTKTDKLLEAIILKVINEVLTEDDGGGDGGGDYGSGAGMSGLGGIYTDPSNMGGMGGAGGSSTAGQALASLSGVLPIGIAPRVIKTLAWGVENMSSRVIRMLKTLYAYVTKAFIPGLDALTDYRDIRKEEQEQLAKTDAKYAETLTANLAVLKDLDAWGVVFLLDPSLGLGYRLVEHAPAAAMAIANSLTGGRVRELFASEMERRGRGRGVSSNRRADPSDVKSHRRVGLERDPEMRDIFRQLGLSGRGGHGDLGSDLDESDSGGDTDKEEAALLKDFFNSKEFKKAVADTGVSSKIQSFAFNSILNRAKLVLWKQTIEELAKIPELAAATSQVVGTLNQQAQAQNLTPDEIAQSKKGALGQLKQIYKKKTIDSLTKGKTPATSSLVDNLIKQIQSM